MRNIYVLMILSVVSLGTVCGCSKRMERPDRLVSVEIPVDDLTAYARLGRLMKSASLFPDAIAECVFSRGREVASEGRVGRVLRGLAVDLTHPSDTVSVDTTGDGVAFTESRPRPLTGEEGEASADQKAQAPVSGDSVVPPPASEQQKKKEIEFDKMKVFKLSTLFKSGTITEFSKDRSEDVSGKDIGTLARSSFLVSTPVEYSSMLWNQQEQVFIRDGRAESYIYVYQSAPKYTVTVDPESKYDSKEREVAGIDGGLGWTARRDEETNVLLKGAVTLYQPKSTNAEANTRSPENRREVQEMAGRKRTIHTVTEVQESTDLIGNYDELQRTTTTTTSMIKTTETDTNNQDRVVFKREESHVTKAVKYSVRPGLELVAEDRHSLSFVWDYVETERIVKDTTWDYAVNPGERQNQRTEEIWVYRFTDNPLTKNEIQRWKSLYKKDLYYFEKDEDSVANVDHFGVQWLVSELEPDPGCSSARYEIEMAAGSEKHNASGRAGAGLTALVESNKAVGKTSIRLQVGDIRVEHLFDGRSGSSRMSMGTVSERIRGDRVGFEVTVVGDHRYELDSVESFQSLATEVDAADAVSYEAPSLNLDDWGLPSMPEPPAPPAPDKPADGIKEPAAEQPGSQGDKKEPVAAEPVPAPAPAENPAVE